MSLKKKLEAINAAGAKRIPPESLKVMHAFTEAQQASGVADRALSTGAKLPAFALSNQRDETVRSDELLARGPLVLTVYRGVW